MPTEEDFNRLVQQNYAMQQELNSHQIDNTRLKTNITQSSLMTSPDPQNLIEYQLSPDRILERIEHLLQGHILKRDEEGNESWCEPTRRVLLRFEVDKEGFYYAIEDKTKILMSVQDKNKILMDLSNESVKFYIAENLQLKYDKQSGQLLPYKLHTKLSGYKVVDIVDYESKPLNEHGVRLVMKILMMYINPNTILSHYTEEEVRQKMEDISYEIAELFYLSYNEMGMNSDRKRRMYPIMWREIVDAIHSAYNRALYGRELDSLRTARYVSENASPIQMPNYPGSMGMPLNQNNNKRWFQFWR